MNKEERCNEDQAKRLQAVTIMAPRRRLAVARTFVAALGLEDVAAGAAEVALGELLVVAGFSPLGALLSSSARTRISSPSMASPLLPVTV